LVEALMAVMMVPPLGGEAALHQATTRAGSVIRARTRTEQRPCRGQAGALAAGCHNSRSCLAAGTHPPTTCTGTVMSTTRETGAVGGVWVYRVLPLQGVQYSHKLADLPVS
jgi:hypothetical protein